MSSSDGNKRIAVNTCFLYIRMCVVMLISLYTTRVVFRVLGTEDYGIYNVVCAFVAMFGIFNTCFSASISRFYNYEIGQKQEYRVKIVYNTSLLIQLLLALLVVLIVELIGSWYIDNVMFLPVERLSTAKWVFHFAVISMFLTIVQAPYSALIMAYEKMSFYAFVSMFDAFIRLFFIFILQYVNGDKLYIYGILMFLISVFNFALYFSYCKIRFPVIRLCRFIDKAMLRSMLSFAGWNLLDPIAYMARDQGTNMVFNSYVGPVANAAQGIAYQITNAVGGFSKNFSVSFIPQIIQSYSEKQYNRTKTLMLGMSKICYMLHIMIVIPLILEIQYVLNLWLGNDVPIYTSSFACIILCITSVSLLNTPISTVASATGHIRKIKVFSAIVISSIVPISIILFELGFPPLLIYIVLFGITLINQFGSVVILHRLFPYINPIEYVKLLVWPIFIYTICVFLLPFLINFMFPPSIWRLLFVILSSIVCAFCFGYIIVLDKAEKEWLKNQLLKKFIRV